jgi:hypothetical protein
MFALIANILAYSMSEDYRFFVKKIKYKQEVVYENTPEIDDSLRVTIVEEIPGDAFQDFISEETPKE